MVPKGIRQIPRLKLTWNLGKRFEEGGKGVAVENTRGPEGITWLTIPQSNPDGEDA